jgi:hypothetical protein
LEVEGQNGGFEFKYGGGNALGLGAGSLLDSPVISFFGDSRFGTDPAIVRMLKINEASDIEEEDVEVCSLVKENQVATRATWIRERLQKEINSGDELWENRGTYFPQLVFLDKTEAGIRGLACHAPDLQLICRHLFVLNNYLAQWAGGGFALGGIPWSRESESTRNNANLMAPRTFVFSDGLSRVCEYHTKPNRRTRIHFFPDLGNRKAYVGHVGGHLPLS